MTGDSGTVHSSPRKATPRSRLIASLKRIREIAIEEHRNDLAKAITQELKHVIHSADITIVVAAEVSRGKSLLVNALVAEKNLLPVDLDVSTGVYVVVKHSDTPVVRVFKRDSAEPTLATTDSLAEWVSVAGNPGNSRQVSYVEVGVPSPLLSNGLSFIDTPGVGGLDTVHGATTLEALSYADALIFVLDASAPLSRPELNFLAKATERINLTILVMTKTDVFPEWLTILDENRRLLKDYAPKLAQQEIIPLRTPLFFGAERRRSNGDTAGADRLLERSGIPSLVGHIKDDILRRANTVKITNGYRLALSVLEQLDTGYAAQIATLSGDTSPLRALRRRERELAELKTSAEGWRQAATRAFAKVDTDMYRLLQEELAAFRNKFDDQIATSWHRGEHLTFPDKLEADLHLLEASLQRRLAESLSVCAGEQAARLNIDDISGPAASLSLPERDRLSARPVSKGTAQLAIVGSGLLSGSIGILKSIIGFNPIYAFAGVLGLGASLYSLRTHRSSAEQAEARRLLRAYSERFQRDCRAAINEAVRSATDTTIEALHQRIQESITTLRAQIANLNKQAAEVKEAGATKAVLIEKRAAAAKLSAASEAAINRLLNPVAKSPTRNSDAKTVPAATASAESVPAESVPASEESAVTERGN